MDRNIEIFTNCKRLGAKVAENQKELQKKAKLLDDSRKKFSAQIKKNLESVLTPREKEFLNLKSRNYDNKTLWEVITGNCYFKKSRDGRTTYFVVKELKVEITNHEINTNGFNYDSDRDEIKNLVKSIFHDRVGTGELFSDFNHGSSYCFYFSCASATFNLGKI